MKHGRLLIIFVVIAGVVGLEQNINAQSRSSERITGTMVGISGRSAGRTRPFTLLVNSFASGAQIQELNEARQQSEDALLRTLSHMNAGRIQVGTGIGVTANAIISTPWENGTKITVLYERNVNFYELRYGSRSADYRFGYAELFLDRNGKGEGTFIPAAHINLKDGNTWEVEDFGVFPARLIGLRGSGQVVTR
ncbi:MAG: hypothetical protein ABR607_14890 [Pyrinomonadaceae bacterium]